MAGDARRRVTTGAPLSVPAATWNSMLGALDWVEGQRAASGGGQSGWSRSLVVATAKNATGADLSRGHCATVEQLLIDPSAHVEEFLSRVPWIAAAPVARRQPVVAIEPIAAGAIGKFAIAGEVPVRLDVSDAAHRWADIDPGETSHLASAWDGGWPVLWKDAGVDEMWAVVLLGAYTRIPWVLAELDEDLEADGSAAATVLEVGESITVWGDLLNATVPSGRRIAASWDWMNWRWTISSAKCA